MSEENELRPDEVSPMMQEFLKAREAKAAKTNEPKKVNVNEKFSGTSETMRMYLDNLLNKKK